MAQHNAQNERIKRQYFVFLKEAKRQSQASLDAVAEALHRFEEASGYRDFKAFHINQAVAFKMKLEKSLNRRSGQPVSASTFCGTLAHLKRFFQWLAGQPGYRSRLKYSDAEYFNPSEKQARIASAKRQPSYPTMEQLRRVLEVMPSSTDIQRRDRALFAFIAMTAARDGAVASLKLGHIDLVSGCVSQDARHVNTKFSKSFVTQFFQIGADFRTAFDDWVHYLRNDKHWGQQDPLFPLTETIRDGNNFRAAGVVKAHWRSAEPIRRIFRTAFASAGLPYFHPHTFRHTLVALGEQRCQTPEEFKAWSQNLGHENVMTTFTSYGAVAPRRQAEIIAALAETKSRSATEVLALAAAVAAALKAASRVSGAEPQQIENEG